jgi:hypothetical protein
MPEPSPLTGGLPSTFAPPIFVGGTPLYFSGEDVLRLVAFNAAAGIGLRLSGRFLAVGSVRVHPFNTSLFPVSDRTQSSISTPFAEGWLLDCSVIASSGSPQHGQTWVRVGISRGQGTGAIELAQLATGYVTAQKCVCWPLATQDAPLDGPGALRSITGTAPAAGANLSETVPTGARWTLIALHTVLTASATVATRAVSILADDGANNLAAGTAQQTQTASQVIAYTAAPGAASGFSNSDNKFAVQLPALLQLAAGFRVRSTVANLQVGDQFSAPQLLVREWIAGE